jgi:hypothetical protein
MGATVDRRPLLAGLAGSVALVAAVGAVLTASELHGQPGQGLSPLPPSKASPAIGDPVKVSLGYAAVLSMSRTKGLTQRQVGMVHGVQGFVQAGDSMINVDVELTNTGQGVRRYDGRWFRLRVGSQARTGLPAPEPDQHGVLQPGASVELTLAYVVPRAGARLRLDVVDPQGPRRTIDLGRIGRASAADIAGSQGHTHPKEGTP